MSKSILPAAACAALLLLAAPAVNADDREGYTGKWVLDADASDLRGDPPTYAELKLEFLGNETDDISLRARFVTKDGDVQKRDYTYVCDGEPQMLKMPDGGSDRKANAGWDGAKLEIHSALSRMGMEFTIDATWTIDGDRLEIHNDLKHPLNTDEWTQVFKRKVSKKKSQP